MTVPDPSTSNSNGPRKSILKESSPLEDVELGVDAPEEEATPVTIQPRKQPKAIDRTKSILNTHTDPFAPREGKALVWRNVNMTLVRTLSICV